jgi:hypothetical protein
MIIRLGRVSKETMGTPKYFEITEPTGDIYFPL